MVMENVNNDKWQECLLFIKDNIPAAQYDAWFSPITASVSDNNIYLMLQSSYVADIIEERYLSVLGAAIRKVYGDGYKLIYKYRQIQSQPDTVVSVRANAPSPAIMAQSKNAMPANPFKPIDLQPIDPQLNPRYTFENYCVSESNKIAQSIGESIAMDPKCKTFNPLFVFGPTGVGKTHLIQAIGIRIKEQNPTARVLYVTARLFESQFTAARLKGEINNFFYFYQSIDTLIVDDIQDLNGKPATQNTFFHIFNHLHQNNKQIILSSDCAPSDMEGFEARLLSRFKWGMSVELGRPDPVLRREVLIQKSEQDGLSLSGDVIDLIAANITDSIRELEGIVVSLIGHATVNNCEVDVDLTKNVLSNYVKISRRQVNFELIAEHVSSYYGIKSDMLFTKSRKREISDARQMIMYLAKKLTNMSLKAIGARIDRTHATVIYACNSIEERLTLEKQLRDDVSTIEASLMEA